MACHYIAKLSEQVEREHVRYNNRYGLAIAADVYKAKNLDLSKKHPALIVGAPYGGVKEQGPCVYANELAKRGFVVLTFDQSFMGESAGEPRNVSSPEIFIENFSAAVDFLGTKLSYVDREKIGAIGICGSGGFALSAAQIDTRIKAIATCSMYVMTSAVRDLLDKQQLEETKQKLSLKRWEDYEKGSPEYIPFFPEEALEVVPANLQEPTAEWFRFYATKRGHHPNARGGFTTTSDLAFLNTDLTAFVHEISPRPILLVIGDCAHSKFFSEMIYEKALEPKELYVVKDAEHIDLYDRVDRIPFDKLENFFKTNLK
ncbi:alpha/beta hydrolase [Turicibacter sanguinis]|uniref:alpha/beta hydrolase n=1 Tax=Turicibacter sanguinis TaxID=154288 RepID=UPI0021D4A33E|nr:alpha/beta hydrolase [Turicibacter sanguinis]MCU7202272.1 alpha/beta hydrolase [Turicibacter sanguinis]MDB8542718.1 alpha/beta hydrolase [Turicibacter sanguinis]